MSQQQISLNADLLKLQEEGYDVAIKDQCLVVASVPYLDSDLNVQRGTLVSDLSLAGDLTVQPQNHVIWFTDYPYRADGKRFEDFVNESRTHVLGGETVHHSFSRKPKRGHYTDYYEKVVTYATYLGGQAGLVEPGVTAMVFPPIVPDGENDSVFNYLDTNSARGQFQHISDKFKGQRIAIIGLGGTGSYILDQVAKCPVQEISLFDGQRFHTHNAFRAPGAPTLEELREYKYKVEYFAELYSKMHRGIKATNTYITPDNLSTLDGFDFVFVSIDRGGDKLPILKHLAERGIAFADCGMGVQFQNEGLAGLLRVTSGVSGKTDHVFENGRISFQNRAEDDYDTNIQIADLNAFNALLAVIKWKKLVGFYDDLEQEHHMLYAIDGNFITNTITQTES